MQELRFSLSHLELTGLAFGDRSKPMILALHGWLDNAASFIPMAEYLSDYYVVALDFAGHGHSQHRSSDAHYHQMDFVQDLHELVQTQQWLPFYLLGHSMGGIIGGLYAASFPEQVKCFVSIEAFGPLVGEAEEAPKQLRESIQSRLGLTEREARHPDTLQQAVQARLVAGKMLAKSAELLVSRNLMQQQGELRWRTDRRLRAISSYRLSAGQAKAFVGAIQAPTLVIAGQDGFKMLKQKLQEQADWAPQLQQVEVPGGHHCHMDEPQAVAAEVNTFFAASKC